MPGTAVSLFFPADVCEQNPNALFGAVIHSLFKSSSSPHRPQDLRLVYQYDPGSSEDGHFGDISTVAANFEPSGQGRVLVSETLDDDIYKILLVLRAVQNAFNFVHCQAVDITFGGTHLVRMNFASKEKLPGVGTVFAPIYYSIDVAEYNLVFHKKIADTAPIYFQVHGDHPEIVSCAPDTSFDELPPKPDMVDRLGALITKFIKL